MPPKSKEKRRRTHTLGGCGTCRRRHVKCDQVRPECLTCTAVGIKCEGYTANVKWVTNTKDQSVGEDSSNSTRRHLYSETSRALMSSSLTTNLGTESVDASLLEIETRSKDALPSSDVAVGPFSVLNFESNVQEIDVLPQTDTSHIVSELPRTVLTNDTPSTIDAFMQLDDSLQWADIFDLDFNNFVPQTPFGFGMDLAVENAGSEQYVCSDISVPNEESSLLTEAQTLIRHFQDHVIGTMGPMPYNTKSPWKIMNLSQAVQTLASLSYLGRSDVSHASIANLYGVLACSAKHLADTKVTVANNQDWSSIAVRMGKKAKQHLQQSFQTEMEGIKRAKYKDQVMALLSTMGYAIISGYQNEVRAYMLDTERLLRARGLAKRDISRRVRLLHHVYTWIRIVDESTYVLHDYKSLSPVLDKLNHQSSSRKLDIGHKTRLDDFLRLETQIESDLEVENQQKDPETGLHDIHLEDYREYEATMYIQIYGIPETWLSLLSHTTRLANVMDTLKANKTKATPSIHESLQRRASKLENMLCSFAAKVAADETTSNSQHYMLKAMNSALVILFYRRIRDVNSWILQSHVDDVIQALRSFDQSLQQSDLEGPGSAWPAFIAGCEAATTTKRERLLQWIDNAYKKSGLSGSITAKEILQELWKRKEDASIANSGTSGQKVGNQHSKATWLDICREKNIWAMLC